MALSQSVNATNPAFEDLRNRLAKAHSREETAKHATAVPVFEVRKVAVIPGFEKKFAKGMCLINRRGTIILDPDVALKDVTGFDADALATSDEMQDNEPDLSDNIAAFGKKTYAELSEKDKWDVLEVLEGSHDVTGYCERAEIVSVHMTPEAAEEAKGRTRLDNGEKAYIFIGSKWNEPEYVALIETLTAW